MSNHEQTQLMATPEMGGLAATKATGDISESWQVGVVQEVDAQGQLKVQVNGQQIAAWVSVWAAMPVQVGQRVLLAVPQGHAALVMGVYPGEGTQAPTRGIRYEAQTDSVIIEASRVHIQAEQSLVLHSGQSQLAMDAHGHLEATAQSILQSAVGSYRLEGATVDIN
jgi:hypothetical protein